MPYKDKNKLREYQKEWATKKRREIGVDPRIYGVSKEKKDARNRRYRYGKFADINKILVELERELNINKYSYN